MKVVREGEGTELTLKVTLSSDDFKKVYNQILRNLRGKARIKGFKPGTAPLKLVENYFGKDRVVAEAVQEAINTYYAEALKREGIEPVKILEVKVDNLDLNSSEPLTFVVKLEVKPNIDLPPLSEITVRIPEKEIGEEDIEEQIQLLRESAAEYKEVDEPVDDGFRVKLAYEMREGDKVVAGNISEEHVVDVDEQSLLPQIYENIIGMKPQEEKNFKVKFPEDFHIKDLAGKEVEVTLSVKSVMKKVLPEVNDEFAKKLQAENLEELKKQIEESLIAAKESLDRNSALNQVFNHLMETLDFPLPKSMVEERYNQLVEVIKRSFGSIEEYLKQRNISKEDLEKELRERAERDVKGTLIMEALLKELHVHVSPKEIQDLIQNDPNVRLRFFQSLQSGASPEAAFNEVYQVVINEVLARKIWEVVNKEYYKEGEEGVLEALKETVVTSVSSSEEEKESDE